MGNQELTGEVVKVGIADMKLVKAPDIIRTSGLGSCVGVVLYEERLKIAGMVHVMLPESIIALNEMRNLPYVIDEPSAWHKP